MIRNRLQFLVWFVSFVSAQNQPEPTDLRRRPGQLHRLVQSVAPWSGLLTSVE